ncbi:LLM class flavin-dependent oxidoreductase [Streptosporangiaceae bacterium NEAU-GS5]|nr:LLM class flavin-dependent oxidoreductase [Streptosporangiaceae bacterium NEAU-GS5]
MADYGHDLLFGVFLSPAAAHASRTLELARLADESGLDLVSLQDHPYQPAFLDTWTLLSVIASSTRRVRVLPNVANLPLRPPAVLAKSVASLDVLSGGRAELGLGAGGFRDAIAALGGPRLTAAQSIKALEEAIEIIRHMWRDQARGMSFEGEFYRLGGARPGPIPVHDVGIWLGAYKPRMLELTGRLADGWLPSAPYLPPDQLKAANQRIDDAAESAGRSPAAVRRLYNIVGAFDPRGDGFLQGPPKVWAEQLAELTLNDGMSAYILMADDSGLLQRFAAEVAPAVRELVTAERDRGPAATATIAATTATAPAPPTSPAPRSRPVPEALGVVPTPDDGVRLSDVRVWDEAARPRGPEPETGRQYAPHERANAQQLIDVHDHLRAELAEIRGLVEQVVSGAMDPGLARSQLNTMTMRQNSWTVGAYCSAYCRVVTMHHTIESQSLFPHLKRADSRLGPVVDRLHEEHEIIHEVLDGVDRALVAFVGDQDGGELAAAVDLLTDALLSHLSYEETELVEPLARLGAH